MPDAEIDPRWWKSITKPGEWVKCETCGTNNAIGVAAVPGIPYRYRLAQVVAGGLNDVNPPLSRVVQAAYVGCIPHHQPPRVRVGFYARRAVRGAEFNSAVAAAINEDQPM